MQKNEQSSRINESLQNLFTERLNGLKGRMTDTEFSELLGMSRNTVGYFTRGERLPNAASLRILAEALHTTADYLIGITDAPTKNTELRAVCDFMGYSQETIENLKNIDIPIEHMDSLTFQIPEKWDSETQPPEMELVDRKQDTKTALDMFFSANGIEEFFSLILSLKDIYEDVIDDLSIAKCPEELLLDEACKNRRVQHCIYDVSQAIGRIAEKAFCGKGEK